jgi:hypothetical protein
MLAMAAGRVKPWHADPVALLDNRHACAERDDAADRFDERDLGLEGPVAGRGVEIGVADPAGFRLDENLTGAGGGISSSRNMRGLPNCSTTAARAS